jgi:hypothetical protein
MKLALGGRSSLAQTHPGHTDLASPSPDGWPFPTPRREEQIHRYRKVPSIQSRLNPRCFSIASKLAQLGTDQRDLGS